MLSIANCYKNVFTRVPMQRVLTHSNNKSLFSTYEMNDFQKMSIYGLKEKLKERNFNVMIARKHIKHRFKYSTDTDDKNELKKILEAESIKLNEEKSEIDRLLAKSLGIERIPARCDLFSDATLLNEYISKSRGSKYDTKNDTKDGKYAISATDSKDPTNNPLTFVAMSDVGDPLEEYIRSKAKVEFGFDPAILFRGDEQMHLIQHESQELYTRAMRLFMRVLLIDYAYEDKNLNADDQKFKITVLISKIVEDK